MKTIYIMTEKARVTIVSYAGLFFEGLMLPDGSFAIALSQAWDLLDNSVIKSNRLRSLKTLLGKDISVIKVSTELNSNKVNILTLEQFTLMCLKLSFQGNNIAQAFMVASTAEKLERIFANAFGQKFNEEEAEIKFKSRMQHLKQYHPLLTRWLKQDGLTEGWQYGKEVNNFKAAVGLPVESINKYGLDEILKINSAEVAYNSLRKSGLDHQTALKFIK